MAERIVQHGIDDDPNNDDVKGAVLSGAGGAVVGAAAGSLLGPAGAAAGAVIGGILGASAGELAVGAVDEMDNDNTVTGVNPETASPKPPVDRTLDGRTVVHRSPLDEGPVDRVPPEKRDVSPEDEELRNPYGPEDEIIDPYAEEDRRIGTGPRITQ